MAKESARKGAPAHAGDATHVIVTQLAAESAHNALGSSMVGRVTSSVRVESYADHPGHVAHRKGFATDQDVKSLAHIYSPWGNLRANGSGILALVAWRARLESEGKTEVQQKGKGPDDYKRGLTHR